METVKDFSIKQYYILYLLYKLYMSCCDVASAKADVHLILSWWHQIMFLRLAFSFSTETKEWNISLLVVICQLFIKKLKTFPKLTYLHVYLLDLTINAVLKTCHPYKYSDLVQLPKQPLTCTVFRIKVLKVALPSRKFFSRSIIFIVPFCSKLRVVVC